MAQEIIGKKNFFEIYLNTPLEVCELRDKKGLYKKARTGIIPDFTGISSPYEAPVAARMTIDTSDLTVEGCTKLICNQVIPLIKF